MVILLTKKCFIIDIIFMIHIPSDIKLKLIELDVVLHRLGRMLYGRKLFGDYKESNQFHNFFVELFPDGAFKLHFKGNILGHIENKYFPVLADESVVENHVHELDLIISLVNNRLNLVSA